MSDEKKTIIKSFVTTVSLTFHPTHDIREEDLTIEGIVTCRRCFLTNDPFWAEILEADEDDLRNLFRFPCRGK